MQSPLLIEFDGLSPSLAVEEKVKGCVAHLEKVCPHVVSCRVVVELQNHKHRKGNQFRVRVEVGLPGEHLVVNREPREKNGQNDVFVAVRDAFSAVERQALEHMRRIRSEVKVHEDPLRYGRIVKLLPYEGYGFIETSEGREVYFDANAVVSDGFEKLEVGSSVKFCEVMGNKGPQATTVHL